ncbi:hypothetical protein LQV63_04265 [Paenibacillus profundus]|uniref:YfhD family protein n=1 Tax=Paenibacillus profundus TaxID=1173085 RepID=A0ABS8Y9I9_9BACL|nr:hypothetical protein [Paenibacillus profundus]
MSDGGITYGDASEMDWDELNEANAAIDILQAQQSQKGKGKKTRNK